MYTFYPVWGLKKKKKPGLHYSKWFVIKEKIHKRLSEPILLSSDGPETLSRRLKPGKWYNFDHQELFDRIVDQLTFPSLPLVQDFQSQIFLSLALNNVCCIYFDEWKKAKGVFAVRIGDLCTWSKGSRTHLRITIREHYFPFRSPKF